VRDRGSVRWLVVSAVLSVVLTALLNVVLRAFPGAGNRVARGLSERASPSIDDGDEHRWLRVFMPWKGMIVASLILTIVVNVVLRIT
jgi:hypothetical protein